MSGVGRTPDSSPLRSAPGFLAVAPPLAVVALAFGLWLMSDRLLYIGPLDRATFGWAVVIPIWASAPLAAGLGWRRLSRRATRLAAATCAVIVGGVGAAVLWQALAFPACEYGPVRQPGEWALSAIVLGAAIGGGFALGSLAACTSIRAGRPWRALAVGAISQVAVVVVAVVLVFAVSIGAGCQRPPT